jgi:hypothetical protein
MMIWATVLMAAALLSGAVFLRRGMCWGSTPEERARRMPGDDYLEGGPRFRVAMTRAVSVSAPPERVWPWLSQLGRGAGWYSVDALDNGRRTSARHLVSWIPEPRLGDATAIGYLRHIRPRRSLAWWAGGVRFFGARASLVTCIELSVEGEGTRLVSRMSADAAGLLAPLALLVFDVIDSIMASRQLIGLRERIEHGEANPESVPDPETGARDQYQFYEILYAGGGGAGVRGKEHAARWRRAAIEDGVLPRDKQEILCRVDEAGGERE